jgi:ABC-type Fe3+/spermidine/putrescine transport system ATPase subunit
MAVSDSSVEIRCVTRRFGSIPAVDQVSLDILRGEFFSLLGPSGCGKTTLLRMIAGLETPSEGRICIHGVDVTDVPAHLRPTNMVFQHYALFPHMTVAENVGFGLRYKRSAISDERSAIQKALGLVQLSGFEQRYPDQLSGGQKQRIALARALVLEPQVLLLDEPLAALDQKLRGEMQVELKALQRRLGITFIFVTHDQEEALTMSDRIAVMNAGRVEQADAAAEVFERPKTRFVAEFMGASNFFTEDGARFVVRPEKLDLHVRPAHDKRTMEVAIRERVYQGINTIWIVESVRGERFTVCEQNDRPFEDDTEFRVGGKAFLCWDVKHQVLIERAE